MTQTPAIWVLVDPRPGTGNQALAVAEALGKPFLPLNLQFTIWANLPNCVLWLIQIFFRTCLAWKNPVHQNWPDMVIAAGRRAAYIARWIKHQNPQTKIVQIMDPQWAYADFDLIAIPDHDDCKQDVNNIIRTMGNPHRMTESALQQARNQWQKQFESLPSPRIALLLGGEVKGQGADRFSINRMLTEANAAAQKAGGSVMITTSRRTPNNALDRVNQIMTVPHFIYDWHKNTGNPYAGILAWADAILVSGDSTSMIAEAISTAKPVYILKWDATANPKHQRLHQQLLDMGAARMWDNHLQMGWQTPSVAVAKTIAQEIHKRFFIALP